MGSWGVKVTESDYGLDLLAVVTENHLHKAGYKNFNVKEALKLLKEHILAGIKRTNAGCSEEEMDFYIGVTYPGRYGQAVTLIAECLVEFFSSGGFVVGSYNKATRKLTEKQVIEFIFSKDDLAALLKDLQSVLDPKHDFFCSWEDSDYFEEWKSHIDGLCESLENKIAEYGKSTE